MQSRQLNTVGLLYHSRCSVLWLITIDFQQVALLETIASQSSISIIHEPYTHRSWTVVGLRHLQEDRPMQYS